MLNAIDRVLDYMKDKSFDSYYRFGAFSKVPTKQDH